jgi:hypothetical protein
MWTARVVVLLPLVVFSILLYIPADTLISFSRIHQENLLKPRAELVWLRNTALITASMLGLSLAWWNYRSGGRKPWDRCVLAGYWVLLIWSISSVTILQIDHL